MTRPTPPRVHGLAQTCRPSNQVALATLTQRTSASSTGAGTCTASRGEARRPGIRTSAALAGGARAGERASHPHPEAGLFRDFAHGIRRLSKLDLAGRKELRRHPADAPTDQYVQLASRPQLLLTGRGALRKTRRKS
jgi:hypothetical protein